MKKALESIIDQHHGARAFEVIVVDNGSTDNTREICSYAGEQITNFAYCYDDEPGQLTGRHRGTEMAKGDIVSFIDDDVELNPQWISSILLLFEEQQSISIIGGPCLPMYQMYPPQWVRFFWQPTPYGGSMCLPLSLIDIGKSQLEIDPCYVLGLNFSIRKSVLLELGGFHPDCIPQHLQMFQGDGETGLSLKARSRNIKALYAASVLLYHQVTETRMTRAYFEKWFYYMGVCQSFTDIRSSHKLYAGQNKNGSHPFFRMSQAVSKTSSALKSAVKKRVSRQPEEIVQLQAAFSRMYQDGYRFHQCAFKTNDAVKEWVLKNDYWNYKVPLIAEINCH